MYYAEEGVKQDLIIAAQWYKKVAESGYALAQTDLGELYLKGQGVTKRLFNRNGLVQNQHRNDHVVFTGGQTLQSLFAEKGKPLDDGIPALVPNSDA